MTISVRSNKRTPLFVTIVQNQRLFVFFLLINIVVLNVVFVFYQQASSSSPENFRIIYAPSDDNDTLVNYLLSKLCKQSKVISSSSASSSLPSHVSSSSSSQSKQALELYQQHRLNSANACDGWVDIIICVHSHPAHFVWRNIIRRTWANQTNWHKHRVKAVFFTGIVSGNYSVQALLQNESIIYNDIVQSEFEDTYRNLSFKALSVLSWVSNYCQNSTYVFKTDDDIIVNTYFFEDLFKATMKRHEIICHTFRNITVKRTGKWAVSPQELPPRNDPVIYPAYCAGMGYIMRKETAQALVLAAKEMPFFWIDDIYVTGFLAQRIKATHTSFNSHVLWSEYNIKSKFLGSKWRSYWMGHARNVQLILSVWNSLTARWSKKIKTSKNKLNAIKSSSRNGKKKPTVILLPTRVTNTSQTISLAPTYQSLLHGNSPSTNLTSANIILTTNVLEQKVSSNLLTDELARDLKFTNRRKEVDKLMVAFFKTRQAQHNINFGVQNSSQPLLYMLNKYIMSQPGI